MKAKKMLKRLKSVSIDRRLIVVFVLVVVGILTLALSQAAQFAVGLEAESGTMSGNVRYVDNESTASAGAALEFGGLGTGVGVGLDVGKQCSQLQTKFCDDFDGTAGSYPDSSKWGIFAQGSSWGSHCWKKSPQNISLDGQGNLKMSMFDTGTVQCTDYYGRPSNITSAGMDTSGGRFTTNQGRFEIRAKLSCATGVWGSFWTSGTNWPAEGEIDIWESMDGNLNNIKHTVHAGRDSSAAEKWHKGQTYSLNERFCDKFRVYAAEWRADYIQFMVDGVNTWRINRSDTPSGRLWPFDVGKHRILITFQYGAVDPPRGKPNPADLPTSMLIDYVRVYN